MGIDLFCIRRFFAYQRHNLTMPARSEDHIPQQHPIPDRRPEDCAQRQSRLQENVVENLGPIIPLSSSSTYSETSCSHSSASSSHGGVPLPERLPEYRQEHEVMTKWQENVHPWYPSSHASRTPPASNFSPASSVRDSSAGGSTNGDHLTDTGSRQSDVTADGHLQYHNFVTTAFTKGYTNGHEWVANLTDNRRS